jgi:hypothetical protein
MTLASEAAVLAPENPEKAIIILGYALDYRYHYM